MTTYYFQKDKKSRSRTGGTNYLFTVWKHTRSGLKKLGEFTINTASYYGDLPEVHRFIAKKEGYTLSDRGYKLKRKDIKVK